MLIGAGIGVTPFASILESIVLRANGRAAAAARRCEKAHFFWLNRDRYSFEWFAALLAELERIDGAGVLDVNIWMTGGTRGRDRGGARAGARGRRTPPGERGRLHGPADARRTWAGPTGARCWAPSRGSTRLRRSTSSSAVRPASARSSGARGARLGMRFRDEKF